MTDLPVVSTPSTGHLGHHNALHEFYNAWRELSPEALDAATLGGQTLAQVTAAAAAGTPLITETITGDGVSATFDVTHNLGTKHVLLAAYPTVDGEPEHTTVRFRPADTNGTNVVTVTIDQWGGVADAVVPDGVEVPVYVWPANGVQDFSSYTLDNTPGAGSYVPYVDPTEAIAADRNKRLPLAPPLYTITGYTATLPTGETATANYATIAAFEAAVVPTFQGQRAQVAGYPAAGSLVVLEGRWNGTAHEWGIAS